MAPYKEIVWGGGGERISSCSQIVLITICLRGCPRQITSIVIQQVIINYFTHMRLLFFVIRGRLVVQCGIRSIYSHAPWHAYPWFLIFNDPACMSPYILDITLAQQLRTAMPFCSPSTYCLPFLFRVQYEYTPPPPPAGVHARISDTSPRCSYA